MFSISSPMSLSLVTSAWSLDDKGTKERTYRRTAQVLKLEFPLVFHVLHLLYFLPWHLLILFVNRTLCSSFRAVTIKLIFPSTAACPRLALDFFVGWSAFSRFRLSGFLLISISMFIGRVPCAGSRSAWGLVTDASRRFVLTDSSGQLVKRLKF